MTDSPWSSKYTSLRAIAVLARASDLMRAEQDRMMLEDARPRRTMAKHIVALIAEAIELLQPVIGLVPHHVDDADGLLVISDVQHRCHEAIILVATALMQDEWREAGETRAALLMARACAAVVLERAVD